MNTSGISELTEIDVPDQVSTAIEGSGKDIENQKFQVVAAPLPSQPPHTVQDNGSQTSEGSRRNELWRASCQKMYEAVVHNNWEAARVLLERDRSLAYEEITDSGDRALHVAISMKHAEFAEHLIHWLDPSELELQDRQGYTACCYAAMMGLEDVARLMYYRNPSLLRIRNFYGTTPLELAVSYGIAGMA